MRRLKVTNILKKIIMTEKNTEKDIEGYRHEYSEILKSLRHYSNLRFAILTVFFGVFAGLIMMSFKTDLFPKAKSLIILGKLAGLMTAIIFYMFAERTITFANLLEQRAEQLERKLGYHAITFKPKATFKFIKISFAIRLLFMIIAVFWLYSSFI